MKSERDKQRPHWEDAFAANPDMFGAEPSEPAGKAAALFKANGVTDILELGAGQGRDTIYFARQGFRVHALEYTAAGVAAITAKAEALGLAPLVTAARHDVREPLPFAGGTFGACYSHMLFCMALTGAELAGLAADIRRVLRDGGLNYYTARTTADKHYRAGIHRGEDMYEIHGYIVHFFSREKVDALARGYSAVEVSTFREGSLPRELFAVVMRK